jgi:hypothetical protein
MEPAMRAQLVRTTKRAAVGHAVMAKGGPCYAASCARAAVGAGDAQMHREAGSADTTVAGLR